jgi:hypothetical protein
MSEQIRISAKNLGELALDYSCEKCFWLKLKLKHRLPFQIFPGIFSSIDSYNKRTVHSWFDRYGTQPVWLDGLGELRGYIEPPHWSKFRIVDPECNILLTGSPDGIFIREDDSYVIVDYKTAKYTDAQDFLLPLYEVQLNVYARIAEETGLAAPISGLALIYMEPVTHDEAASEDDNHSDRGFRMHFHATVKEVPLKTEAIRPLLARTREIYEMSIPGGRHSCKNCELLREMFELTEGKSSGYDQR